MVTWSCRPGAGTVAEMEALGFRVLHVPPPIGTSEQRLNAATTLRRVARSSSMTRISPPTLGAATSSGCWGRRASGGDGGCPAACWDAGAARALADLGIGTGEGGRNMRADAAGSFPSDWYRRRGMKGRRAVGLARRDG